MSRSKKKYHKAFIGNDRPFKIEGRRNLRNANKRVLKNLLAHKDIEAVSDEVYDVRRVNAMDPWAWPSDGRARCFFGTEERYMKECENEWKHTWFWRSLFKNKEAYMEEMKKRYHRGIKK